MGTLFRKIALLMLLCTGVILLGTPASADRQTQGVRATVFVRAPLALDVDAAAFNHPSSTAQREPTEQPLTGVAPLALRLDPDQWSQQKNQWLSDDPYVHPPHQPHNTPFNTITREENQHGTRLVYTLTE